MDRRTFLKAGAATGAMLALPGCTSSHAALPHVRPSGPGLRRSAGPGPAEATGSAWAALGRSLDGSLLLPGDPGFGEARRVYAPRFDALLPVAVVQPEGPHDVAEAIRFARRHRLRLRPRSGGHSYVGASAAHGGIALDLSRMATTSYDAASGTAHVGAGARALALHDALDPVGRTVPTGTCPTVGAGLALGGGIGAETRSYGLTCDSLDELEIVTADGRVRRVGPRREPALFWACRGGGGGNVGVVTALRFRTWPAEDLGFFQLDFDAADAAAALQGWQRRLAAMPRDAWSTLHLEAERDGTVSVRVFGVSVSGDGSTEAAAVVAAVGRQPVRTLLFARSHYDGVRLLAGCAAAPEDACGVGPHGAADRQSFVAGSDVLAGALRPSEAGSVLAVVRAWAAAGHRGSVLLDALGGRAGEPAVSATAFPWRDALATVQWFAPLGDHPRGSAVAAARRWVAAGHRAVAAASAGAYVNYLEPGRPMADYYGANYARLRAVRGRYDPSGFFDSPYSVPRV